MKNHKNEINKNEYRARLSSVKLKALKNFHSMQDYEIKEKEMIEKLKTTAVQVNKMQDRIRQFEMGKIANNNRLRESKQN